MGSLWKLPIVSLLFAVAIGVAPLVLEEGPQDENQFEAARDEARRYLVRNPNLEVDALGELMLDAAWIEDMREAAAREQEAEGAIRLPTRMLARSQARLDDLIATAYAARMRADPAWRLGVLDAQAPPRNYLAHAFIHEAMAGLVLGVLVCLFVAAPLERTWGSLVFAAFALPAIPFAAYAYRLLDAVSGVPWSGSSGLAAAIVGAYFIRGLGGHFTLPGWVLLPAWLAAETFVVRNFWIDDLGSVPWATLCASVGFGAAAAGALRLMNVESKLDAIAERSTSSGPNPIVSRAARLRSDGDPYQAFDLMQAAWRDDPKDLDVVEAFFAIAVEVGQPEAAAEAILPQLRGALRKGDVDRALEYWLPLASRQSVVALDATPAVRLGEALLDKGQPAEALFTLRLAIDSGVSPAHAARIAKLAHERDSDLARRAAAIAMSDPSLDPRLREELDAIAAEAGAPAAELEATLLAAPTLSRSQLDRRVSAEHQPVETTAFPLEADADIESTRAGADAHEASLAAQSLDRGALSEASLSAEVGDAAGAGASEPSRTSDVLSHWNERDAAAAASDDGLSGIDVSDLELPGELDLTLGVGSDVFEGGLGVEDETDSDLTPLMDASDEATDSLATASDDPMDALDEAPTVVVGTRAQQTAAGMTAIDDGTTALAGQTLEAMTVVTPRATTGQAEPALRELKALEAVPIDADADWVEIDATGRGKSKLPLARIEAIGMAAVMGLASRPVLVIDFVLNWSTDIGSPMKVLRLRSDRFDPNLFAPGASTPLEALRAWIAELQIASGAACLPTRELLEGRYARFESLEAYEREVLRATPQG